MSRESGVDATLRSTKVIVAIVAAPFGSAGHLTWQQECARAALVFAYGLVLVRLAGRRVFGRWAALDLVVSIMVGANLSRVVTGNSPLVGTLAASTMLMVLHWLLAHGAPRWQIVSRLVEGEPVRLGEAGRADAKALVGHAVGAADLSEALRRANLERIEQARLVMLEPSGKISILK